MLLYKLWRLSGRDRAALVEAALLLLGIRFGLLWLPFRRLRRLLARLSNTRGSAGRNADTLSPLQIANAVLTASRYVPAKTCLMQALAVQVLLTRKGYRADLGIGVAKTKEDKLEAHAWVKADGIVVIGGSELRRYTPLLTSNGEGL